ncbi:hypothetical protein Tco_0425059 [Tanacetum coccineum]
MQKQDGYEDFKTSMDIGILALRSKGFFIYGNDMEMTTITNSLLQPDSHIWKGNAFEGQAEALHRPANGLIQRASVGSSIESEG